jgi:GTPase SAR1 family protein
MVISSRDRFKVIICGGSKLKEEFLRNTSPIFSETEITMGVDIRCYTLNIDENPLKLEVWIFKENERFKFLRSSYILGTQGGFFLYDINDDSTLNCLDEWLQIIKKTLGPDNPIPLILIGLTSGSEKERKVNYEEGLKLTKLKGLNGFFECNWRTSKNVHKAFETLAYLVLINKKRI